EDGEEDDDTPAIGGLGLATTRAARPRRSLNVAGQRRSSVPPPISAARRNAPRHDCRQQTRVRSYPPPWRRPHQPENPRPQCNRRPERPSAPPREGIDRARACGGGRRLRKKKIRKIPRALWPPDLPEPGRAARTKPRISARAAR